ncbi:MAG: hypothetical protein WAS05_05585 [Candidatus Nanopelagicales bacterium]
MNQALVRANAARRQQGQQTEKTLAKAIRDLKSTVRPVTVADVAAQAQVSKRQAYYYQRILDEVRSLRDYSPFKSPGRTADVAEYRTLQAKYASARGEIRDLKTGLGFLKTMWCKFCSNNRSRSLEQTPIFWINFEPQMRISKQPTNSWPPSWKNVELN